MSNYPLSLDETTAIVNQYGSPLYLYDEKAICINVQNLFQIARKYFPDFQNFFAVKALPNPNILKILLAEGCGFDCASIPELWIANKLGANRQQIIFTSNYTKIEEFNFADKLGVIINLDHESLLESLLSVSSRRDIICFRYNPGDQKSAGNSIIGKPTESKFGMSKDQILLGISKAIKAGFNKFALHAMTGSNVLEEDYFSETANLMLDLAGEIWQKFNVNCEFINTGGGFGIPYLPEQKKLNIDLIFQNLARLFDEKTNFYGYKKPKLYMENGRYITGPYGFLITKTVAHKTLFTKKYIGVDASMANLMRPGMYNSYHEIEVLGRKKQATEIVNIVGPLCENNDFFARERTLPISQIGDLLVIKNAGAHASAMGFQYNGRLRCAEVLLESNGATRLIRRAETTEDYFQTSINL